MEKQIVKKIEPATPANPFEKLTTLPEEITWLANKPSKATRETYKIAVEQFMAFFKLGNVEDLRQVNGNHLIAFREHLQQEQYKNRSINNRISALSSLFNHLVGQQILKYNPAAGLERMKVDDSQVVSLQLSEEEARAMLEAPVNWNTNRQKGQHPIAELQVLRDLALLYILFFRGCRATELTRMKVRDYYPEAGYPKLKVILKGGKERAVAIHLQCKVVLDQYLAFSGHGKIEEAPLLLPIMKSQHENYRHLKRNQIELLWKKYASFCGIERTTPHSARTTFATIAGRNGATLEQVQYALGHADSRTTKAYQNYDPADKDSASFKVHY